MRLHHAAVVGLLFAATVAGGCARRQFVVSNAPALPQNAPHFRPPSAELPLVVQITNFTLRNVDTQFSDTDEDRLRRHYALAVPNLLQEFIGKRQVFGDVTRAGTADPRSADYIVTADYDFLLRNGTQGREWIPYYGAFAEINEAWGRDTIDVRVTHARSGVDVLRKAYTEEHRARTRVNEPALVYLLQDDYMSRVATGVIEAIRAHALSVMERARFQVALSKEAGLLQSHRMFTRPGCCRRTDRPHTGIQQPRPADGAARRS
jgi:hypothetical protein